MTDTRACDEFDCDGERHLCPDCEDGYVVADCFEDCCPHTDPETAHGFEACDTCGGRGCWPCPATASTEGGPF